MGMLILQLPPKTLSIGWRSDAQPFTVKKCLNLTMEDERHVLAHYYVRCGFSANSAHFIHYFFFSTPKSELVKAGNTIDFTKNSDLCKKGTYLIILPHLQRLEQMKNDCEIQKRNACHFWPHAKLENSICGVW